MDMEQLRNLSATATDKLRSEQLSEESGAHLEAESAPVETTPEPVKAEPVQGSPNIHTPEIIGKDDKGVEEKIQDKLEAQVKKADKKAKKEVAPKYTPSFKYKVAKEEKEFPEAYRAFVKDETSEKAIRELLEKSDGLEHIKGQHSKLYETYQQVATEHQNLTQGLAQIGEMVKAKDFDSFFEVTKIPEQAIMEWAVRKAQEAQLPPERKQEIEAQRFAQKRAQELEHQSNSVQQMLIEQASQTRRLELKMATSRPEYSTFIDTFDAKVGTPGAFMDEVVKYGKQVWDTQQVDISPEEAVKAVYTHYSKIMGQPQVQGAVATQPTVMRSGQKSPPVIPNIQGDTTSPTKAPVKTLDDLRKLSRSAGARVEVRNG